MTGVATEAPVSKLFEQYAGKKGKKKKKLKKKCCEKYLKKKGKYCDSCPTLLAIMNHAGRDI